MTKMKTYKDEKYIYLLMAYNLAKGKEYVAIGKDNGYVDGYHYEGRFTVKKYQDKTLLIETKSSKSCADYSRVFEVIDNGGRIIIRDYINESGENGGANNWRH
jgi:hypothetical protein